MHKDIHAALTQAMKDLGFNAPTIELTRPDPEFGDWSTNIALRVSKQLGRPPREVAQEITDHLRQSLSTEYEVNVAGPGFINIRLPDSDFIQAIRERTKDPQQVGYNKELAGKVIVVEFTDPNPFKELHIGHLYSNTIGEAIARLYEAAGATVKRVSYHGDVGLHVAKAMWVIQRQLAESGQTIQAVPDSERPKFLGAAYALGAQAYESNPEAKQDIIALNKQLYEIDKHPELADIYRAGRGWSFAYFDTIYKRLNSHFDKQYFESDSAKLGVKSVELGLSKGIFEKSDGAVIFPGEKYGLHTRVFVNSAGLPTYEAKDLGLAPLKARDYTYDRSIIITAEEQTSYFKVVLEALRQLQPELGNATQHIAHGVVKLSSGKMSSRTGKVITAESLLNSVEAATKTANPDAPATIENAIGAIKYSLLKHRIGGDIVYDVNESISMEGNSGPYIQYAHARARRILSKQPALAGEDQQLPSNLTPSERSLMRHLLQYDDELKSAIEQMSPHIICTYLYSLAQEFNRFYEHNQVIGDERQQTRLALVQIYANTIRHGLTTLNIAAPESM